MAFKRSFSLCIFVVLVGGASLAEARPLLRPGVEVGYAYSILRYDEELPPWTPEGRFVFSGGAFLEIVTWEKLRVVPGIRYVRMGNRVDVNTGPDSLLQTIGDFEITQDYLTIPVLLKLKPARNSGFFVIAGPELGFLVSARQRSVIREIRNRTDVILVKDEDENIEDRMEAINLSLIGGLGAQTVVKGHALIAQVRYDYGLVGTARDEDWFSNWNTEAIEFLIGVAW